MFHTINLSQVLTLGLSGTALLGSIGVAASPVPEDSAASKALGNLPKFFKGFHVDNTTGYPFELYTTDNAMDEMAAFAAYVAADEETGLSKRDWYDCNFARPGRHIQRFCCNTAHGIGTFVSNTGAAFAAGYINNVIEDAFNGKRDGDNPRSICLVNDNSKMCVSWAQYTYTVTTSGENKDISNLATNCGKDGGSAEFKTDGKERDLYICVSNRADGCGIPKDGPV